MTTIDPMKKDFIHGLFTVKFKNIVFYQEKISRATSVQHVYVYTHTATFVLEKMKQINKWEGFLYFKFLFYLFEIAIVLELIETIFSDKQFS